MPYPQISQQTDIRQSYLADVYDIAHYIQTVLEPVLRPPEPGVYLPNQLDPVLRIDRSYWFQEPVAVNTAQQSVAVRVNDTYHPTFYHVGDITRPTNQPWQYFRYNYIPVTHLEQTLNAPWDVVEMEPGFLPPYYNPNDAFPGSDKQPKHVALPHHLMPQASLAPALPVVGIKIAQLLLENEVASTRRFNHSRAKLIEEIVLPFIDDKFLIVHPKLGETMAHAQIEFLRDEPWFQRALSGVFDSMLMMLVPVRDMLRHNAYQICTVQYQDGYTVRIDQLGDYRIHEWERIENDPDYVRWQRMRANGTWDRIVREQEQSPDSIYSYR